MDSDIIKRCVSKDKDAFSELVSAYQNKVYALALNMLRDENDALDASQEVFIKVYKSINKFGLNSSLSTWIYKITYNTVIDILKKRKKIQDLTVSLYKDVNGEECEISITDRTYDPQRIAEDNEGKRRILSAIDKLKTKYRTLIILRFINGLTYNEISDITRIPLGSVKSGINRAKDELKKILLLDS